MKTKYIKYLIILVASLILTGCSNFRSRETFSGFGGGVGVIGAAASGAVIQNYNQTQFNSFRR